MALYSERLVMQSHRLSLLLIPSEHRMSSPFITRSHPICLHSNLTYSFDGAYYSLCSHSAAHRQLLMPPSEQVRPSSHSRSIYSHTSRYREQRASVLSAQNASPTTYQTHHFGTHSNTRGNRSTSALDTSLDTPLGTPCALSHTPPSVL